MKNMLRSLAKSVLKSLGLLAAASVADTENHKKIFELGITLLILSNEEMEDVMKIVMFL